MINASERSNYGEEDPLFFGDDRTIESYLTPLPVDAPHYRCECCQRMIDDKRQEYWYVTLEEACHLVKVPMHERCNQGLIERGMIGVRPLFTRRQLNKPTVRFGGEAIVVGKTG